MKNDHEINSVNDIMARMTGRMDALLDAHERTQATRQTGDIPEELRFWLAVDPLLSDLHKQFLDARASHMRLARLRGAGDPMTDVANDMVDSAQCAFETRLIELRMDEDSKAMVLALMRRAHNMREDALNEEARERSTNFWKDFAKPKSKPKAHRTGSESFFLVMIGLMILRQTLENAERQLSIAMTFNRATDRDRDADWRRGNLATA